MKNEKSYVDQLEQHEKELIEQLYQKDKEIEDLRVELKQLEDSHMKLFHENIDFKVKLECVIDNLKKLKCENRELREKVRESR